MSERRYVYLITVHPSEKKYVGQTKDMDNRFAHHLYRSHGSIDRELKRIGERSYMEMIELWKGSIEDADDIERYYIKKYCCLGESGLNKEDGGLTGFKHAEDTKEAISDAITELWADPDFRNKAMAGIMNAWDGNEARRKHISECHKEKFKDLEYKKYVQRASNKMWNRPVEMYDPNTGEVLAKFTSATVADRLTGAYQGHISKCCTGRLNTLRGFGWRYIDTPITDEFLDEMESKEFIDHVKSVCEKKDYEMFAEKLLVMFDPETGVTIKMFRTVTEGAEYVGGVVGHIAKCVAGAKGHLTHKGFGWRHATPEEAETHYKYLKERSV